MATVSITLPDSLDAALTQQMVEAGARSKEDYLIELVEADCKRSELERILADRSNGPFAPLEIDWKQRVREIAAGRAGE